MFDIRIVVFLKVVVVYKSEHATTLNKTYADISYKSLTLIFTIYSLLFGK